MFVGSVPVAPAMLLLPGICVRFVVGGSREGGDGDEGGAEVADPVEQAVQLGLVADDAAKGAGAVVLVGECEAVEPRRPVRIQVTTDSQLVRRGRVGSSRGHDEPARAVRARLARRMAGRRMTHSAT